MENITLSSIPIEDINIGMTVSYSQVISDCDIRNFANVSGDYNPVHLDEKYAESSLYKKRIAHGLMSASYFSGLFGTKIPGPGCVYVSQSLAFKRPVYINDEVTATVEVTSINIKTKRVYFKTVCTVRSKVVLSGEAEIYIP